MLRVFLLLAAFFGFTGVALGAFAAHGLKGRLTEQYLAIFHTGVTYQLVHTLALFGVALLATHLPGRLVTWAGVCFAVGIVLFSGSLYAMALTDLRWLGAITPIGGMAFLIAWLLMALGAWRVAMSSSQSATARATGGDHSEMWRASSVRRPGNARSMSACVLPW